MAGLIKLIARCLFPNDNASSSITLETDHVTIITSAPVSINTVSDKITHLPPLQNPKVLAVDDTAVVDRNDFPDDFIFGTATSSYQFEGGAAEGGRGRGIWDAFSMETPEKILDGSNGNIAVDMYNRYKEDIQMMNRMGFNACRISISWPRILPGGRCSAGINREGINYYNDLINSFLAHGIEPYVTLFHWDLPYCLQQEYHGFLSDKIVDDFREFAEVCFWEFGDRVKKWITLNEPWSFSITGYVTATQPPADLTAPPQHAYTVTRNLLLAHSAVVHSYRTKFQDFQHGSIGIILCCQWFEPFDDHHNNIAASNRAIDFMLGWFLEPVLYGTYPKTMVDLVNPEYLQPFSQQESEMLKGSIDFLGLNYYTANYVRNDDNWQCSNSPKHPYFRDQHIEFLTARDGKPIGPQAASTWLYIVPWGIHKLLKYVHEKYQNIPIYITENGVDEKNDSKLTAFEACKDTVRIKCHQDHLEFILKAIREKVNVKGYFVWSWCDNFEWQDGYTVRFGLIYIDFLNNLTRYPKDSALWFSKFLQKRRAISNDTCTCVSRS